MVIASASAWASSRRAFARSVAASFSPISRNTIARLMRKSCTSDLKTPGNPVYVVGATHDELGGSHWYRLKGKLGSNAPQLRDNAPKTMKAVHQAIKKGWVRAAHDPSEGGLAVAAAEMAFASDFGMKLDLRKVKGTTKDAQRVLFSESASRFLLEVDKAKLNQDVSLIGSQLSCALSI